MRPLHVVPPPLGIEDVAEHDVDGYAIHVRVVDRHGGMLQAHGSVGHHHHGLAFDLGVAVRHRDRGLFVAAREQLRHAVAAVVDQRFVQGAERPARVGRDVLDAERLDHVHHEIGPGAIDVVGIVRHHHRRGRGSRRWRLALRRKGRRHESGGTRRGFGEKPPPPDRTPFRLRHVVLQFPRSISESLSGGSPADRASIGRRPGHS